MLIVFKASLYHVALSESSDALSADQLLTKYLIMIIEVQCYFYHRKKITSHWLILTGNILYTKALPVSSMRSVVTKWALIKTRLFKTKANTRLSLRNTLVFHLIYVFSNHSSLSLLRYCWDKKKYHNIQTIGISSINFYCFVIVGILIWYHNKQHFELLDIIIARDCCMLAVSNRVDPTTLPLRLLWLLLSCLSQTFQFLFPCWKLECCNW